MRTTTFRMRGIASFSLALIAGACLAVPVHAQEGRPGRDRGGDAGRQDDGDRGGRRGRGGFGGDRGGFGQDRGGFGGRRGGPGGRDAFGGVPGGGARAFMNPEPEFIRRDVQFFVDRLELDDGQGHIVESLVTDYGLAFDLAAEGLREKYYEVRPDQTPEARAEREARREDMMQRMRAIRDEFRQMREATAEGEEPDPEVLAGLRDRGQAMREEFRAMQPERPSDEERDRIRRATADLARLWQRERNQLRVQLVNDVIAILAEPQLERWPATDRELRRVKTLGRGRLAGESADLAIVLNDVDAAWRDDDAIAEIVDVYHLALDDALVARNDHLFAGREAMMQALLDGDMDRALELTKLESELRTAVRDVNVQYAELIAAVLDDAQRDAFERTFRDTAFARIYRPTRTARAIEMAKGFEDLSEDALAAVIALEETYRVTMEEKNAELLRFLLEEEPKDDIERMQRRAARMAGEEMDREEDALRLAFDARQEIDDQYRRDLESYLTDEQRERLPAVRRGRGNRGSAADREQRRAEFMKRFDTNGDGQIDDAEREEIRRQFREGGFDRGRGRGGDRAPGGRPEPIA